MKCTGRLASNGPRQAVLATSLLDSVDGAGVQVSPEISKAYQRVQNGSDIRGVAIAGMPPLKPDPTENA